MHLTTRWNERSAPAHRVVVAAGIAFVVILVGLLPRPASASTDGVLFGARVQAQSGEDNQKAIGRMEATAGRKLDVVREFLSWDSVFPQSYHTWLRDTGHTMILSVKSKRENGQVVLWRDIAAAAPGDATYDSAAGWADRLRDYGRPVYFAFNHEPESSASSSMGSAPEFIAAWRRMHDIFAERGATNVKFIWIMTDYAFFVGPQAANDAAKWFPGDAYLDAMGIDAYNWFTCRPGINNPWKSLEQIIKPFRDFGAQHPDKELWLTEWASAEDPAQPNRKPAWIDETRALFKRPDYAQFRGISYFNYTGTATCKWKVDSSAVTTAAFRAMAQDTFYGGPGTPDPPVPAVTPPTVVASASTNGNRTTHRVQVPSDVRSGDLLLVYFMANQNPVAPSISSDWTTVDGIDSVGNVTSRLWSRTATSADPGSTLTITTSVQTKSDLKVVAVRGAATPSIDARASHLDTVSRLTYVAPSVTPATGNDLLLVYWADKSSTNDGHTIAASLAKVEPTTTGLTGGHITATLATGNAGSAGVATETFAVTLNQTPSRAVEHTLALR